MSTHNYTFKNDAKSATLLIDAETLFDAYEKMEQNVGPEAAARFEPQGPLSAEEKAIAAFIRQHGLAVAQQAADSVARISEEGSRSQGLLSLAVQSSVGTFASWAQIGEALVDVEMGVDVPDALAKYIDYERLARDAADKGSVVVVRGKGHFVVFCF